MRCISYLFIPNIGMVVREQAFIGTASWIAIYNPNQDKILSFIHRINFSRKQKCLLVLLS